MMINMNIQLSKIFLIIPLAAIALSCNAKSSGQAQNNSSNNSQGQVDYTVEGTIYKRAAGWNLPNLSKFDVEESRHEVKIRTDRSAKVFETHYLHKYPGQVMNFPPDDRPDAFRIRVSEVWEYDVNGHKFSYKVLETPYAEPGHEVGTVGYLIYYDEDGDGRFETVDGGDWNKPLHVPEWISK